MPVIADILAMMESIAPRRLAQDWDNCGLQIGDTDRPVRRIMIALDPTPEVIQSACDHKIDLLITHHPLIFKPLRSIDLTTPLGRIIQRAIQHHVAIFSAHTNLDTATNGLNDLFLEKIGVTPVGVLCPDSPVEYCKLSVYVPVSHCQEILDVFFQLDASSQDKYTCCTFRHPGTGTFKPGPLAQPFLGKPGGGIVHADEVKIEARFRKDAVQQAVEAIRSVHPYESMAYDVYPLENQNVETGFGRIGRLENPMPFLKFSKIIKSKFKLRHLKISGPLELMVRHVAVCTGSGSSMMPAFLASSADVFISGDLKYHDARDAEICGKGLIDAGHFASEAMMIHYISERLKTLLKDSGVSVLAWDQEKDPFVYV